MLPHDDHPDDEDIPTWAIVATWVLAVALMVCALVYAAQLVGSFIGWLLS